MKWISISSYRSSRAAAFGLAACGLLAIGAVAMDSGMKSPPEHRALATAEDLGNRFAEVTEHVAPAVVHIQVAKQRLAADSGSAPNLPEWFNQEEFRRFFGDRLPQFEMPRTPLPDQGQGSGFVISADGYVLTNSHVVGGVDSVEVTFKDGRRMPARIIGVDPRTDVAVIKVEAKDLPTLQLGNSDEVRAGEWVLAVGSPFGLTGTVTSGIVSAVGRNNMGITDYEDFIQTDAAINPGNSGGPLVNLQGEVIGINTAIFSRSGGYQGIGFAIPVNMAHDVCDQLIASGSVTRGQLGIVIQQLSDELAASFGLKDAQGVLVGDVAKGSPAEQAGLKAGDVVVAFEGKPVTQVGAFRNAVAATRPGQEVSLDVIREGQRQSLKVEIGRLESEPRPTDGSEASPARGLGLRVQPLTQDLAERLGVQGVSGVVISGIEPDSAAARAGLATGMLILEVDRRPVASVEEFQQILRERAADKPVLLLVREGDSSRFVVLSDES